MAEPRPDRPRRAWDGAVAVVSFSDMAADQRVRRQCGLLENMGHAPLVVGHGDAGLEVGARFVGFSPPRRSLGGLVLRVTRQMPAHLGAFAARAGFWSDADRRRAAAVLREARPRLIIANDWPALMVAAGARLAGHTRIHYDAHEFAAEEFDHSAWWRLVYRPFVRHLEREGIAAADSISTVGAGLSRALAERYGLGEPPLVIRNVPDRATLPAVGGPRWPLRLLYHGIVIPHRGLEELIASASLWTSPHSLLIRGHGAAAYLAELKALAARSPAAARIRFEPSVAPRDVVPAAARDADVGVFFPPLGTIQQRFMLPNKLFEYIAAGLAVAVSPAPDMAAIIERHRVGLVATGWSAPDIAAAINRLEDVAVTGWKAAARAAAAELNWENESLALRARIAALLAP